MNKFLFLSLVLVSPSFGDKVYNLSCKGAYEVAAQKDLELKLSAALRVKSQSSMVLENLSLLYIQYDSEMLSEVKLKKPSDALTDSADYGFATIEELENNPDYRGPKKATHVQFKSNEGLARGTLFLPKNFNVWDTDKKQTNEDCSFTWSGPGDQTWGTTGIRCEVFPSSDE